MTDRGKDKSPPTKQRILDTAERLFAERGIGMTSLRAIVAEAGVNLAAIHYHFGSKEALVRAVVDRRIGPINAARIEALDAAEARSRGHAVPLAELFDAFAGPMLRAATDPEHGSASRCLMGRLLADQEYFFSKIVPTQFAEVRRRFANAFSKALPKLEREEVFWRLMFTLGAVTFSLQIAGHASHASGGIIPNPDPQTTYDRLRAFSLAGFKTPSQRGIQ